MRGIVITTVVINSACYRGDSGHDRGGVLRGVAVVVVIMVVVAVAITSDHHTARYDVACQEKCNEDLLKATSNNYINQYIYI